MAFRFTVTDAPPGKVDQNVSLSLHTDESGDAILSVNGVGIGWFHPDSGCLELLPVDAEEAANMPLPLNKDGMLEVVR